MKKLFLLSCAGLFLASCGTTKGDTKDKLPSGGFNLFTVEQDIALGAQVAGQIDSLSTEYPVLDSASNVAAYAFLYNLRDRILATGKVKYANEFVWQLRIIEDDSTLNAFCTPGGYIYVYTGIIKYLDTEDQLAGVMGHEMAHADLRHSTRQMTKSGLLSLLVEAALGNRDALKQITSGLIGLKFSRAHETEADQMSVHYLCGTEYDADGGAGFFEKIEAAGGSGTPEFMSTHPSPANRVANYHKWAKDEGCAPGQDHKQRYENFKQLFN
ncbi:MAG: M48 family metalloprotease [Putridiphycobacter sp.]|nr:M48 family metalloprotease [Putridiphycobacter sp.]